MSRGKMKGDNSADSKNDIHGRKSRESGGTTKSRLDMGKQDNNKAANTKTNLQ